MTDNARDLPPRLLAAYLSGECSAADAVEVARWARASRENEARLEHLEAAWKTPPASSLASTQAWNTDEMWTSITAKMDVQRPLQLVPSDSAQPARRRRDFTGGRNVAGWATIAASVLIV